MRGFVVAAPRSGAGKTTVTLGLLAALRARGVAVRGAKAGPDYIDPAFHEAATGVASVNLDGWAMPEALIRRLAWSGGGDELLVVEGAMGLFDGAGEVGPGGTDGSAAALAVRLGLPVLLVLDVGGQAQTAGAVALGMARFDPRVRIGGVVLNNVASERHRARAAGAVEAAGLCVLGSVKRRAEIALPSRHLGLVGAGELALGPVLARLVGLMDGVDLDRVCAMAEVPGSGSGSDGSDGTIAPPGQRIALARDEAFAFAYPHLVDGWRAAGAEVVAFSPLANEAPDPGCDAVWLPGGYPELHAGRLAGNGRFLDGLRGLAARVVVHGECGGLMVLGRVLVDGNGVGHAMAGLLDLDTSFAARRLHLGYRTARLLAGCAIGPAGATVAGHEFHYATVSRTGGDLPMAAMRDADGAELPVGGLVRGRVSGCFFHAIARVAA